MHTPSWWQRRRFGLAIHANLACVPAWAPRGEDAAWYASAVDGEIVDAFPHPSPLAETLSHHATRWSHLTGYDEFASFLTFEQFDPDEWASVAADAGMGYAILTAKHLDGLCWWDAPDTDNTVVARGPRRNVLAEFADACERSRLVFGTSYSLLDWSDPRYPGERYVDEILHPHVLDLVDRYGARLVWGEAHWGAGGGHWRSNELLDAVRDRGGEIAINDRWWADRPGIRTYKRSVPDRVGATPWETHRPLGASFVYNRVERADDLLTAPGIVAVLTEVVAKGGHLTIAIGPDRWGVLPVAHVDRLREAGRWVRAHQRLVDEGEPWTRWGDRDCRYIVLDGAVHAIDVGGAGTLSGLAHTGRPIASIVDERGERVPFECDGADVRVGVRRSRSAAAMPAVYRIAFDPAPPGPIPLFVTGQAAPTALSDLLAHARPGDVVQLGDGAYSGPATVPAGVVVRGLGPHRTVVEGGTSVAITLGDGARIEYCRLTGGGVAIGWLPRIVARCSGDHAAVIGCTVDGHVGVDGDDARIASCRAAGVVGRGADHVVVTRSTLRGADWDVAIDIEGGTRHLVESCEITGPLVAIRLRTVTGATVRGNTITGRWWGVRVRAGDGVTIVGNSVTRTMRAVDIDGGVNCEVTGNAVFDGDSGCLVQRGASETVVAGNHWERCRVGLLGWGCGSLRHHDNTVVDLDEPGSAAQVGP